MKAAETRVYEFTAALALALHPTDPADPEGFEANFTAEEWDLLGQGMGGAEVHDNIRRLIETDFGIRIGDATGELALAPGTSEGVEIAEADVLVPVVTFAKLVDDDPENSAATVERSLDVAKAFFAAVCRLPTLNGRVQDAIMGRAIRGFDNLSGVTYAVVNLPLVVNGTGQEIGA